MPARTGLAAPLLVRVDPHTRAALDQIAATSERTLSQLVRYATMWWLADPDRTCPAPQVTTETASGTARAAAGGSAKAEFINVRFTVADMAAIRSVGASTGLGRGSVVRCAVRAWLASGDLGALGDPRRALSPDPADYAPA